MAYIHLQDQKCWMCNGIKNLTTHHALPQHLKPKNNVLIPLCNKCHKKINSVDITGMYSYVYKMEQLLGQIGTGVRDIKKRVEDYVENSKPLNKRKI